MKYCYGCNHVTAGQPLFCNSCGRSYDVKLCPRHHVNSRTAQACSQCGSREFSTPQPRVPAWVPVLQFLLKAIPGAFLFIASVVTISVGIYAVLHNPYLQLQLAKLLIVLAVFWWLWSELPSWLRTAVYRMLKRKREGSGRNGGHA